MIFFRTHTLLARCRFVATSILLSYSITGCSLSDLVNSTRLSSDALDPKAVRNEQGALGLYNTTLLSLAVALGNSRIGSFIVTTGISTDELTVQKPRGPISMPPQGVGLIDARSISQPTQDASPYRELQLVRGNAQSAREMLQKYAPNTSRDLIGHLWAMEGIAEVMLSELYCSGIPLSTIDFEKDYTLSPGLSTRDVLQHAIALFDSADSYVSDSTRIQHFIRISRGRALLGLGEVEAANVATADVPTSFQYILPSANNFHKFVPTQRRFVLSSGSIGNREGQNGLPFGDAQDPRIRLPALYDSLAPLVLGSGVEARLIAAEAALYAHREEWLDILNRLRTTCRTAAECPQPAPAGDGGVSGLPPLVDPSPGVSLSDTSANHQRLVMIFEERAYWLFLRGNRQGDLRRLVRLYQWPQQTVYPTGDWGGIVAYGSDVNMPLPMQEQTYNTRYKGCLNRDA